MNVLSPDNKSESDIRNLVKLNSRWIYKKQLRLNENKYKALNYFDGSKLPYLGKEYSLSVISNGKEQAFSFQKGIFVATLKHPEPKIIMKLYEKWLERQTFKLLDKIIHDYCQIIRLNPDDLKIRIKSQKKRAGSLGRNLVLNFNRNILRLPIDIIEYIVVHELCHIHIPSHSKKYWQLVTTVLPDYKNRKEWLEKNKQLII